MRLSTLFCRALLLAALCLAPPAVLAYPDGPVRVIVPQPAGSGTDVIGRLLATELSRVFGQNFFVENRPGANGVTGTAAAAAARPDGHTLLVVAASVMVLNPHLFKQIGYQPEQFAPVAFIGETTVVVAAGAKAPFQTLPEMLAAARGRRDGLSYAIPQVASMPHLMGEMIRESTGAPLVAVPFRGDAGTTHAILAGDVDVMMDSVTTVTPLARDGRVRVLAVGSSRRLPGFPDAPTLAELVPGADASGWFGVFAPSGTPEPVLRRLNQQIASAVRQPGLRDRLVQLGVFPVEDNTPQALEAKSRADLRRYGELIRARNIQTD